VTLNRLATDFHQNHTTSPFAVFCSAPVCVAVVSAAVGVSLLKLVQILLKHLHLNLEHYSAEALKQAAAE
jgi:hypothetical protein